MSTAGTRSRKSKLPGKPAPGTQVITCARPGCGREFPPAEDRSALEPFPGAGDFRAVRDSSRVAGWLHDEEIGDVCPSHRDHVSRWPGAPRLGLPARVAGSTRAEFLGVVPLPALEPGHRGTGLVDVSLPADEQHMSVETPGAAGQGHVYDGVAGTGYLKARFEAAEAGDVAGVAVPGSPAYDDDDLEPLPPLPQREPAGPPEPHGHTVGDGYSFHTLADWDLDPHGHDLEPVPPPDRRDEEQADAAALLAKWGAKPKDVAALDSPPDPLKSLAPGQEDEAGT